MGPDGSTWTNSSKYQIQEIGKEIMDICTWLHTLQEKMEELLQKLSILQLFRYYRLQSQDRFL